VRTEKIIKKKKEERGKKREGRALGAPGRRRRDPQANWDAPPPIGLWRVVSEQGGRDRRSKKRCLAYWERGGRTKKNIPLF